MSPKIEREKTLRAQAMALPAAQQKILLAYLAGLCPDKVESGLEFLASLGITDVTDAPEAGTAEAPAAEPAPARNPRISTWDVGQHLAGSRRSAAEQAARHLTPVRPNTARSHLSEPPAGAPTTGIFAPEIQWSCVRCDTNPVVSPGERRRSGSFDYPTINGTYCAACQAESTGVCLEDDGSTTLSFGDPAGMHPGGYAAGLAATQ